MMAVTMHDSPCGMKGGSNKKNSQHSDSLKNRNFTGKVNRKITLDSILKHGNDMIRFRPSDYVSIEGYVVLVKLGSSESCNCNSKNPQDKDIHVQIVKDLNNVISRGIGTNTMIVEINRYTRDSIDYKFVKSLWHKKVKIQGWMFADVEHKQNSYNTATKMTNIWRATLWEVHPVMSIKEIK